MDQVNTVTKMSGSDIELVFAYFNRKDMKKLSLDDVRYSKNRLICYSLPLR